MREPDKEVKEVKCSETGKAMPKIPQWMADVKVKFVCEEVRQRHTSAAGLPPLPARPALPPIPAAIAELAIPDEDEEEEDGIAETGVAAVLPTNDDDETVDPELDGDIENDVIVGDDVPADEL